MSKIALLSIVILVGGLLEGCEPAPSTKIAPDTPPAVDLSKVPDDKFNQLNEADHARGQRR